MFSHLSKPSEIEKNFSRQAIPKIPNDMYYNGNRRKLTRDSNDKASLFSIFCFYLDVRFSILVNLYHLLMA